jgi:HPt (histidine-containing phosphotransfer) domain-containing protein
MVRRGLPVAQGDPCQNHPLKRIMGDESLAKTLKNRFLVDMPAEMEQLKAAIVAGDVRLAGQQANRIQGAASNMGGIALQRLAYSMELAGQAGDLKALGAMKPGLEEQFQNPRESLKKAW